MLGLSSSFVRRRVPRRSNGVLAVAALALLASLGGCAATRRPDGNTGMLPPGSVAPDFVARDAAGAPVRFSSLAGHPRVVYFYPKDETPGCTKEACAFRDAFAEYEKRGVVVFGVSRDSEASHEKFRKAHALPFLLAADESGEIQRAYGAPGHLGVTSRVTFLVGADGRVQEVWEKVDPAAHAADVLAAVK
ncbi:MAG TPA: peroxiredoxin [Polyangiaceae bacterium]|nr:peroxiredoxin [Polyangiaceae bacterium]